MLERVRGVPGGFLSLEDYLGGFRRGFERGGDRFAKFERRQTFREPGDPSWEAFHAGDWQRSVELNEEDRAAASAMVAGYRKHGYAPHRLRVVEFPISPYLQWEMQFFRLLVEEGQDLRVLRAEQVAAYESTAALPELVMVADRVMYEVLYDDSGAATGGRRIADAEVIAGCRADLVALFAQGEPLLEFFDRHIAPLPPPAV